MSKTDNFSDLSKLLNPNSVAIVGASSNAQKLGNIVVRNIQESGFKGTIYPVNPNSTEINGLKVYKSLAEINKAPDLVIISLPVDMVLDVLQEVVAVGSKNVVVFTAGFKEIGEEGKKVEEELKLLAKEYGLNILGPNCLGFASNLTPINATFGKVSYKKGPLRFVSQSGAVASAIFDWADSVDLGFEEFITLGNKAVLNENHVLSHWLSNSKEYAAEEYAPIGMYLESISNGSDFMNLVRNISLSHPVFVLKPGKSNAAKKAMQSHTGAIAGEDFVLDQAFKQCGITRCHDIQDMFDLCMAFSWMPVPAGPNIAVISNAGGPGVITSDLIVEHGMQLATLSDDTRRVLKENLPRAASILNPVDVLGDALADRYEVALSAVLKEDTVDAVFVILTPQLMTQIDATAEVISELSASYKKPVFCAFIGGNQIAEGEKILTHHNVPVYRFPERAIKVMSEMWQWSKWVRQNKASSGNTISNIGEKQSSELNNLLETYNKDSKVLDIMQSNEVLKMADIPVPQSSEIQSFEDAVTFASKYHFPIVLKVSSPKLLHKKDSGGVLTNINKIEQLNKAYKSMSNVVAENEGSKLVIQKQVESGLEVIVGIKRDSVFGNVLMFGAGGTLTELIQDRNLYILPVDEASISKIIEESKIFKLLKGYRGDTAYDISGLENIISKLVRIMQSTNKISEIEVNPVIVTHNSVFAVDGKILL